MEHITKPSITRLARRAGVKSISEDCYPVIHQSIGESIENIIRVALVVNGARTTKTLMVEDVYDALHLKGHNVAQSTDMNTSTCLK